MQSRVIVITAADVCEIVTKHPLASLVDNPSRLQVLVLADPARRRSLAPLLKKTWAPEALALDRRVAYAWCPGGVATSPLMEALGRIVGNGMTARNIATMSRIDRLARVGQE